MAIEAVSVGLKKIMDKSELEMCVYLLLNFKFLGCFNDELCIAKSQLFLLVTVDVVGVIYVKLD